MGYSVWWDQRLRAGQEFSKIIEKSIRSSEKVIVLWSRSSACSEWVSWEASLAQYYQNYLPVTLDGTIPDQFSNVHLLNYQASTFWHTLSQGLSLVHEGQKINLITFGVGGAGCNTINNCIAKGLLGEMRFLALSSDKRLLETSSAGEKVLIGAGERCQGDAAHGSLGAMRAEQEIMEKLRGVELVVMVGGLAGGTGGGATPEVARICKRLGIPTIIIGMLPFVFEGAHRMEAAVRAAKALADICNCLVIIPNQYLFRIANESTTFADAFAMVDSILEGALICISELILGEGAFRATKGEILSALSGEAFGVFVYGESSMSLLHCLADPAGQKISLLPDGGQFDKILMSIAAPEGRIRHMDVYKSINRVAQRCTSPDGIMCVDSFRFDEMDVFTTSYLGLFSREAGMAQLDEIAREAAPS